MKTVLAIIAATFTVSACISNPKTRDEYVNMAEARNSSDIKKEAVINKPFAIVNENLAYLSKNCLNKTVTIEYRINSSKSNEYCKSIIDYHSTFSKKSKDKSEFTILTKPQAVFSGPSEPVFVFTADASPVDNKRTQLIMYKSYGYDRFVNIVQDAASGTRKTCPHNIH